jgi:predicted enzyme related to lactoylglutathione lyase
MPDRDGYIPGVPCWVDTNQPDPAAAIAFYGDLFGWQIEDVAPPGSGTTYAIGRIRGGDAGAVSSIPPGAPPVAKWNTYIWVDDADETAAKARNAGGTVVAEPFEVPEAGRMAIILDPEGAEFCLWQPRGHKGAKVVNEHGSVNFNGLATRDPEGARAFYGAVFGWKTLELQGGANWMLPGYGDHLEQINPGTRAMMSQMNAPEGFIDVVASLVPIADDDAQTLPHWSVTFGVDDVVAIAARARELGAELVAEPFDAPWCRMAFIKDPQGATFIASQFVIENRDLVA